MKKIKRQIFFVIFSILNIFLFSILLIFNIIAYVNEKTQVEEILTRLSADKSKTQIFQSDQNFPDAKLMQYNLYYIKLSSENEPTAVVGIETQETPTIDIVESAKKILNKIDEKTNNENQIFLITKADYIKVTNLYTSNYSYIFKDGSYLILFDNSIPKKELINNIVLSCAICIVLEILVFLVTSNLTKYLLKPIKQTIDKQKQFIADASHELKTPLAVIMANSEALANDPTNEKWLNNIILESSSMSNLVTSLLDMARLDNNNDEQKYENENISKIIENNMLTFESLVFESGKKLKYDIQKDIYMKCNKNDIKELLQILVDNAIKYSYKKADIIVILKQEKQNIILIVKDKGKPIDSALYEKIFERFFREDKSRDRKTNQYGLGLSIAKNIVEKYNGNISCKSEDGYNIFTTVFHK